MLVKRIFCSLLLFSFLNFSCEAGKKQTLIVTYDPKSSNQIARIGNFNNTVYDDARDSRKNSRRLSRLRQRLASSCTPGEWSTRQKVVVGTFLTLGAMGIITGVAVAARSSSAPRGGGGGEDLFPLSSANFSGNSTATVRLGHGTNPPPAFCPEGYGIVGNQHQLYDCKNEQRIFQGQAVVGGNCTPNMKYLAEADHTQMLVCSPNGTLDGKWQTSADRPSIKRNPDSPSIVGCTPGETVEQAAAKGHPGGSFSCGSDGEWSWQSHETSTPAAPTTAACGPVGTKQSSHRCMPSGFSRVDSYNKNKTLNGTCTLDVRFADTCTRYNFRHLTCWDAKCGSDGWREVPVQVFDINTCQALRSVPCTDADLRGLPGNCWLRSCPQGEFTEIWSPDRHFMISTQYGDKGLVTESRIKNTCEQQIQLWAPNIVGVQNQDSPHRVVVTINTVGKEWNSTGGIRSLDGNGMVTEGVINISEGHFQTLKNGTMLCSHEMGHVLVQDPSNSENTRYRDLLVNFKYCGPRTVKYFGGCVPLHGSYGGDHWAYDLVSPRTGQLISGLPLNNGHTYDPRIGGLNWCALFDQYWQTVGCPVPPLMN